MNHGKITSFGEPEKIIDNDEVRRTYMEYREAMETQLTNNEKLNSLLSELEKRIIW